MDFTLKKISSTEEVQNLIQRSKKKGSKFQTNFYFDTTTVNEWINQEILSAIEMPEGTLFYKSNPGFSNQFYCFSSLESLNSALAYNLVNEKLVIDLVGKSDTLSELIDVFKKHGFELHTQLNRYMRLNDEEKDRFESFPEIKLAELQDAEVLHSMFINNFDKYAEQIPHAQMVDRLIRENKIFLIRDKQLIKGFLVRSNSNQTSILNNFLVESAYRGQKIGSKLLKHYLAESRSMKKMLLWVLKDNKTAISIYEQHGYKADGLIDVILMK